ncbi:hypothetical protein ARMGADRAFT_1096472 [Armillaria gallica]|uniref:Peptidase C14 caspase domain-containing protein n=1 Tax=Armillaria gallica TaxID=47427 RepID=A0A2H3EA19_ARMGA|nr:hypothetical protein ARMGADRAFT_1096472 [Armillaria gallica]
MSVTVSTITQDVVSLNWLPSDGNTVVSESEPTTVQISLLEELEAFELTVAERLGMSGDVDEVALKTKASRCNDDILSILGSLHHLRLQLNRAQDKHPIKLEVYPSFPGSPSHVDSSRFYAVLIDIDEYASYPLQGCVSDARLMEKYLTEDLGVPRNRIKLLIGSTEHTSPVDPMNPSCAHIIGVLLSLIDNPEILYGDNIIIYYSGHGSYYPFPAEEEEDDGAVYIEALCPIDRDIIGDDKKPVPDISDREFNTILTQISRVKGHCITVILDCCHSSSVSRGLPELGARESPPTKRATPQSMLLAGDKTVRGFPGYRSVLLKDWRADMNSHVLLAACKDYQFAKLKVVKGKDGAKGYIGIFTDLLVHALRSGSCTRETTYIDLVCCLDQTQYQTPVVAGSHNHARIWYQE